MSAAEGGGDRDNSRKSPKRQQHHKQQHELVPQEDEDPQSPLDANEEEQWEKRLLTGDLPEDFLKVTDPDTSGGSGGKKMAYNHAFEPELGDLVDFGGTAAAGAFANPTSSMPSSEKSKHSEAEDSAAAAHNSTQQRRPMSTEEQDRAMALALQEQLNMEDQQQHHMMAAAGVPSTVPAPANMLGKLTVTVVEARLAKNYGYVKMDPYCRVRVGHSVYETPTCPKGSKEPKWNNTFTCYLLQGIRNVDVEVYDECTFTQDSLIAHGSLPIPETVLAVPSEVADEWFPLSGNEGTGKEGMIHLILSLQPIAPGQPLAVNPGLRTVPNMAAGHRPMQYQTAYVPPQHQQQQQQPPPPPPPKLTEEELEEFVRMFPNLDKEIILSVFQASRGNKEDMVNNLLQLGDQ